MVTGILSGIVVGAIIGIFSGRYADWKIPISAAILIFGMITFKKSKGKN